MTKKELIKAIEGFDDHQVVIVEFPNGGWSNIEKAVDNGPTIELHIEKEPIFSDN